MGILVLSGIATKLAFFLQANQKSSVDQELIKRLTFEVGQIAIDPRPAGIFLNSTNERLFSNVASARESENLKKRFKGYRRFTKSKVVPSSLSELQQLVFNSDDGDTFTKTYTHDIPGIGLIAITDRFTVIKCGEFVARKYQQLHMNFTDCG